MQDFEVEAALAEAALQFVDICPEFFAEVRLALEQFEAFLEADDQGHRERFGVNLRPHIEP